MGSPGGTGSLRPWSMPCQVPCRIECQPEDRPPRKGEVDEAATSIGTNMRIRPSRSAQPATGPASRLTWSAAVADIIALPAPAKPRASKCVSIAR